MKTRNWTASPITSSTQRGAEGLRETSPRTRESPWSAEFAWTVEMPPEWLIPGIQKVESGFVTNFADMDAGRAKPQGLLEAFGH